MQTDSPHHSPRSEHNVTVTLAGATAMGSANTAVIRYTAAQVTNAQNAVTFAETAAAGASLTIVRPGLWAIDHFAALAATGNLQIGISLNAANLGALTGPPVDFAATDAGAGSEGIIACAGLTSAAAEDGPVLLQCSRTLRLVPGDVLRFMATAAVTLDTANTRVFMTLLAA